MTTACQERSSSLGLVVAGLALVLITLSVPVDAPSSHAREKHGEDDVVTVRTAMREKAASDPTWFDRPPCRDGRYRFWLYEGGRWLVWVLEPTGQADELREVTAFVTHSQSYVSKIAEDCGNGAGYAH